MSALLAVHGWGAHANVFEPLADELGTRGAVTSVDLPGYGGRGWRPSRSLEDIVEAIAEDAPPRCSLLAWSLGAQVAMTWARLRPQQIDRLVLIAATPCFVQRPGWSCAMEPEVFEAFAEALAGDPAGTLSRFSALVAHGDAFARRVRGRLREAAAGRALPDARALHDGLEILRTADLRDGLRDIMQPALVIHGARDRVTPPGAGEALAAALPDARLAVLSGAAHAPFVSQPRAVATLITEFLDGR